MVLSLPDAVGRDLIERAREGRPEEVCGVLGGEFTPERSRVRSSHPVPNAASAPRTRYRLDPEDALAAFERIEAAGESILGFYHSHPRGPPTPSPVDAERATWPDRSYVIVSLEDAASDGTAPAPGGFADETIESPSATVASWRWRGDELGFERERVVPVA